MHPVTTGLVASVNLGMVNVLSMVNVLYADYYANKLYKLRRGPQKLGGPVSVFVPSGKISLRGPG